MHVAGMVYARPARSVSSHVASRTYADRAAVNTRNLNASLTAGCANFVARTVSMATATSLCGSACRCATMSFCGPSTGTTRSEPRLGRGVRVGRTRGLATVGRVVVPQVQGYRPLQHRADALADLSGRRRLGAPDGYENRQDVSRVDFGDGPAADAREHVRLHAPPPAAPSPDDDALDEQVQPVAVGVLPGWADG